MNIQRLVFLLPALLLTGCMMAPNSRGGVDIIPILPAVVEVDDDSHYFQGGYHYFYADERWYYATTRDGRRTELPRSHWARETRRRGRDYPR